MTLQKKYLLIVNAFLVVVLAAFFVLDIRKTERIMTNQAIESLREIGDAISSIHSLPQANSILSRCRRRSIHSAHSIRISASWFWTRIRRCWPPHLSLDRGRIWEEEQIWKILRGQTAFSHRIMSHNQTRVLDITLPLTREGKIIGALHISKSLQSIQCRSMGDEEEAICSISFLICCFYPSW